MTDVEALNITINGREYEVSPPFTNRELHLVKQIANVRAGEFFAALAAGDTDVVVALSHIALRRAGATRPTLDELWELPATALKLEIPDLPDEDPDPTTAAAAGGNELATGSPETSPNGHGSPRTVTSST